MYNVTVTTKIEHLDGKHFNTSSSIWANVPYEGIIFLQKIGLEGLTRLLEETEKVKMPQSVNK